MKRFLHRFTDRRPTLTHGVAFRATSAGLAAAFFAVLALASPLAHAATTRYWDPTAGAGNGTGGTGTWTSQSTTIFSTTSAGDANQSAAATTDPVIFGGTAGTVTLGPSTGSNTLQAASFEVSTTGYTLMGGTSATVTLTGAITLDSGVGLTLSTPVNGGLTVSSITGFNGTGANASSLAVGGAVNTTSDAIRINLASGASIDATAPITISTTGNNGIAGFVSSLGTATINAAITNNTNVTTMLGTTSSKTLNVNGVVSGSAGLQFSAGTGGGTGTINLNAQNSYGGATTFNAASSALIKLGIDNALSTTTNVTMAASSSNGGILDLNGHNQEIASLTSGAGGGSITNGAASGTGTLTVSGSGSPAAFGLAIMDGTNAKTALVRSGTGTLTLSGVNTYTGKTQIGGGTLVLSSTGSINGSTLVQVGVAGTTTTNIGALTLNNVAQLSDSGTLSMVSGTTLNLNAASGSETIATLILDGVSQPAGTYTVAQLNALDTTNGVSNITFTGNGETLTVTPVPEPATVLVGVLLVSALGWHQRRRLRGWLPGV